mmetsp:Transcript_21738/g.40663  ORF Transcript_21738/g.40663 Transcript_21738/m.40663 type:complete len:221 (-) Transcript_21738:2832-3494(-)
MHGGCVSSLYLYVNLCMNVSMSTWMRGVCPGRQAGRQVGRQAGREIRRPREERGVPARKEQQLAQWDERACLHPRSGREVGGEEAGRQAGAKVAAEAVRRERVGGAVERGAVEGAGGRARGIGGDPLVGSLARGCGSSEPRDPAPPAARSPLRQGRRPGGGGRRAGERRVGGFCGEEARAEREGLGDRAKEISTSPVERKRRLIEWVSNQGARSGGGRAQ